MNVKDKDKDEAIQLVMLNQNRKFELNEEALKIISKIQTPIGVVAVAGQYRTGKSFLMNRIILNRSKGFEVGNTVNACTKGLWMWSQPIKATTVDGRVFNYFVVDTEGTGCLGADQTHSARILTLASLFSSLLIYNQLGALDEQAVEDLALLSALVKHIQLKSENSDPEEYSQYFPQFLWILRDFSLQLKDNYGESISSKDYMERFLQQQQGISDGIEQRNRIRRLITAFFRQRDCATLVRPINDEGMLQNLWKTELDQMRPEFIEQTMNIRRKINLMIQPKSLRGVQLTGQSLVALMREYVHQMNVNYRVQVEWVWDRIQKDEAQSAQNEAFDQYEKYIIENVERKLPLMKEEMKSQHKRGKELAMEVFNKRFSGEAGAVVLRDLNKKFKQKMKGLQQANEQEALNVCNQFIQREFQSIQRRMVEYQSIVEFERDIKLFYQFSLAHGPKTVLKQQVYLEFYHRMINEGSQMFIKHLNIDLNLAKKTQDDLLRQYENKLIATKNEKEKEISQLLDRIRQCERERGEDQARLKRYQDQFMNNKEDQEQIIRDLQRQIDQEKNQNFSTVEGYKYKIIELENQIKQMERQNIIKDSEYNKSKALMEQKNQLLSNTLDDQMRRGQQLDSSIISTKSEYSNQIKEVNTKYDIIIQTIQESLDNKVIQYQQLQSQFNQAEQNYNSQKEKWEQRELSYNQQIQDQQQLLFKIKQEMQQQNLLDKAYCDDLRNKYVQELNQVNEICRNHESLIRDKQEKHQVIKQQLEKEKAMLQQRIQFLEVENSDLKQQFTQLKKNNEATLQIIETNIKEQSKQGMNRQILELKEAHMNEIKQVEQNCDHQKKILQSNIDSLQKELNDQENRSAAQITELSKELQTSQHQIFVLDEQKAKMQKEIQNFDSIKGRIYKDADERAQQRIKLLEQEIEEVKQKNLIDVRGLQDKIEDQMLQLRNVYELEKDRLERKIQEERENADQKYQSAVEEFEQKRSEEQQCWEDEVNQLKDEIQSQDNALQNITNELQNEIEAKDKQIQELEIYKKELKAQLQKQSDLFQNQITQRQKLYEDDIQRVVQLEKDLKIREDDLQLSINKRYQLEDMANQRDQNFEQQRSEWLQERNTLNRKMDELKCKNDDLVDDYLSKKINLEKNLALSQQHSVFLECKVNDLQQFLDQQQIKYENNIRQQLREQYDEFNDKIQRMNQEKKEMQERIDDNRMQLKYQENKIHQYANELEIQNQIQHERSLQQQESFQDKEIQYHREIQQLQMELNEIIQNKSNNPNHNQVSEISNLKAQIYNLESDKAEIQATYERDSVLWQGKFNFMEDQKDQAKRDLQEAMIKFEQTLDFLQKARQNDRADDESSLSEVLKAVEKKYQLQLLDYQKTNEQKMLECEERAKYFEREYKQLQDKTQLEAHSRLGSNIIAERKITELLDYQQCLLEELDASKAQKDTYVNELNQKLDNEKKQWKTKLLEIEERLKETEKKRSNMIFEHEKERAKWALERDHLSQRIKDIQDMFQENERKKDYLQKDYDKLKAEIKNSKRINSMMISQNSTSQNLRKSPNKSPINNEVNRSGISIGMGTNNTNRFYNYENSIDISKPHVTFSDEDQQNIRRSEVLQNLSLNMYPGESFEHYYAQMIEKK